MSGFFAVASKQDCVFDLFFGTDYHSHLGTRRGGMATYSAENGFKRVIHSIQHAPFRTKFEDELSGFSGNAGIGIISDTDAQPLLINSHLGRFAISTVGKILNAEELVETLVSIAKATDQPTAFLTLGAGDIDRLLPEIKTALDNL